MIDLVQDDERTTTIRRLNDNLRRTGTGGRTVLTRAVSGLPTDELATVVRAVAAFDDFKEQNDPYGEHDCAIVEAATHSILWKIDYYNDDLDRHSDDPADPNITCRVLTIMLAGEY
jgi:hypothetical protein